MKDPKTRPQKKWLLIIALITLLLSSCSVKQPVPLHRSPAKSGQTRQSPPPKQVPSIASPHPAQPEPAISYAPRLGAGSTLYTSAQDAMARGNDQQAEMLMERALKIEPRNAHYWYTMARVKFRQHQYSQTVHLCSKSKSLAGGERHLLQLNDELSARARERM